MADARRANVVGLGLIGGSISRGLVDAGWRVSGHDVNESLAHRALEAGYCSGIGVDEEAEISFVAVPALAVAAVVKDLLSNTTGVITDVASVKGPVVDGVDDPRFVAGHPMAGSEQDGLDGADPEMFLGAAWVLTPTETTDDQTFAKVASVVRALGGRRRCPATWPPRRGWSPW